MSVFSILVVDDEPDVDELFRQCFRREARGGTYVMRFASSDEIVLEQLSAEIKPPLIVILSDINMPGMDGLTLLERIKQRFPEIPVMMVTAYGDNERRQRENELGACEFLTKPVDFDRLKTQMRHLAGSPSAPLSSFRSLIPLATSDYRLGRYSSTTGSTVTLWKVARQQRPWGHRTATHRVPLGRSV